MSDIPKRLNTNLIRQAAESDPDSKVKAMAEAIWWLLNHVHEDSNTEFTGEPLLELKNQKDEAQVSR